MRGCFWIFSGITIVPLLIIAGIFLFFILGGTLIITQIPILNIMFRFYMLLVIYSFVTRTIGRNAAGYAITLILGYIFVWRLFELMTGIYLTYLIMSFGFSGILIFGFQGLWGRGKGGSQAAMTKMG